MSPFYAHLKSVLPTGVAVALSSCHPVASSENTSPTHPVAANSSARVLRSPVGERPSNLFRCADGSTVKTHERQGLVTLTFNGGRTTALDHDQLLVGVVVDDVLYRLIRNDLSIVRPGGATLHCIAAPM